MPETKLITAAMYRKLIQDDLDWLKTMPPSTERDHIALILNYECIDMEPREGDVILAKLITQHAPEEESS